MASSASLQAKHGGVIPEQAAREQIKSIIPVIEEALNQAFPKERLPRRSAPRNDGFKNLLAITIYFIGFDFLKSNTNGMATPVLE